MPIDPHAQALLDIMSATELLERAKSKSSEESELRATLDAIIETLYELMKPDAHFVRE